MTNTSCQGFFIILVFTVLKHASAEVHLVSALVRSSTTARNWNSLLFWLTLRHNLHSSIRLVGHPAVHSFLPADEGKGVRQCFSADSSPEQQIERLRIPLTDVCDHCSSEIKSKREGGQRFNSQGSGLVLRRPAVLVLDTNRGFDGKKLPHLAGWLAFMRQGVWG